MYDAKAIQAILPHRHPFLLIDRIIAIEEGKSATGISNISMKDAVFQGHFPDEPIYPGVLIVEAMAQVGAVALLAMAENKGKKAYFTRIQNARFQKPVRPGDVLEITTSLTKQRLNIGFADAVAKVGEDIVCQATIAFALGD